MREPEIDEIWYTWSAIGLSGATAGYRVRAASAGLSDLRGARFRSIDRYLRYTLPQGINPNSISPQDAPTCLALINNGEERILVHKVYVGRDAAGRPGIYFTHLLAGLPASFTARQAIRLWGASLWQVSDVSLEQQPTTLRGFSYDELCMHANQSQVTFDFAKLKKHLLFIIKAFFVPAPQQRPLYIVGQSQDVAALIWGLTHSLPSSLLAGLTFTTYEHDVSAAHETIVGTVTFQPLPNSHASKNHMTINCDMSPPDPPIYDEDREAFVSFAMQHLTQEDTVQATVDELLELITRAEAANITTTAQFIAFFRDFERQKRSAQCIEDHAKAIERSDTIAEPEIALKQQELALREEAVARGESELTLRSNNLAQKESELAIAQDQLTKTEKERYLTLSRGLALLLVIDIVFLLVSCGLTSFALGLIRTANLQSAQTPTTVQPTGNTPGTQPGQKRPDDYVLIEKSDTITVQANKSFFAFLAVRNTGTNTWSGDKKYKLICTPTASTGPICTNRPVSGLRGYTVQPGDIFLFYLQLTAPSKPGLYAITLTLTKNDQPFAIPNDAWRISVNVQSSVAKTRGATTWV